MRGLDVESHRLAFEQLQARPQIGDVNENVRATAFTRQKSVTFGDVEELDRAADVSEFALCHFPLLVGTPHAARGPNHCGRSDTIQRAPVLEVPDRVSLRSAMTGVPARTKQHDCLFESAERRTQSATACRTRGNAAKTAARSSDGNFRRAPVRGIVLISLQ